MIMQTVIVPRELSIFPGIVLPSEVICVCETIKRFHKCCNYQFAVGRIRPVCGPIASLVGRAGSPLHAASFVIRARLARECEPYLEQRALATTSRLHDAPYLADVPQGRMYSKAFFDRKGRTTYVLTANFLW
jgi:hypothetical protein